MRRIQKLDEALARKKRAPRRRLADLLPPTDGRFKITKLGIRYYLHRDRIIYASSAMRQPDIHAVPYLCKLCLDFNRLIVDKPPHEPWKPVSDFYYDFQVDGPIGYYRRFPHMTELEVKRERRGRKKNIRKKLNIHDYADDDGPVGPGLGTPSSEDMYLAWAESIIVTHDELK